ncbi:MAG: hypothetical protein M5R36_16070 [Deltaproteobacteria bacterium]|nr:hypothetical protein [Deltaproteobacteria bacterium]
MWEVLERLGRKSRIARSYFLSPALETAWQSDPANVQLPREFHPLLAEVLSPLDLHAPIDVTGEPHFPCGELSGELFEDEASIQYLGTMRPGTEFFMALFQSADEVGHGEWGFFRRIAAGQTFRMRSRRAPRPGTILSRGFTRRWTGASRPRGRVGRKRLSSSFPTTA